jgi:hypothetical protein
LKIIPASEVNIRPGGAACACGAGAGCAGGGCPSAGGVCAAANAEIASSSAEHATALQTHRRRPAGKIRIARMKSLLASGIFEDF